MTATAGRVDVPGYRHTPGNHCGSTALRNLLAFHGTEVSEEMVLGLGAGACFYYLALEGSSPSRFANGRAARLEENFLELTGTPLRLRTEPDPRAAWALARETVDAGRPALLLTDLFHLDHYGDSARFPGHAVVLAGYDEEFAYLSDTGFEELQTTRLENLAKARHGNHAAFPLEGHAVDLPEGAEIGDLKAAIPAAVAFAVREMSEPAFGELQGLPALRRLAAEIADWPGATEDWQWCARFLFQVIERRGTGGGNFRLMYSRFLEEAGYVEAALAAEAAVLWTALAEAAANASESEQPEPALWQSLGKRTEEVLAAEQGLWSALARSSG